MSYLFDTNVISEIRHPQGSRVVKERFCAIPEGQLFTSAIVYGELTSGIAALSKSRKKSLLEAWCREFEDQFSARILPFDRQTAKIWGNITATCREMGTTLGAIDGQIAATAISHQMVLITRNEKHFKHTGVKIWNIWKRSIP